MIIFTRQPTTEDKEEVSIQLSIIQAPPTFRKTFWRDGAFASLSSALLCRGEDSKDFESRIAMEGSVDETRQEEVALDVSRAIKYFMYNLQLLPQAYTGAETNRMTLCYFCVSALDLLGSLDKIRDKQTIIEWIYNLQIVPGELQGDGGKPDFWQHSGFIGGTFMGGAFEPKGTSGRPANEHLHGHIAMTYTSIATLLILGDDLSRVNRDAIAKSLAALQDKQGNFVATYAGSESDLRFVYCASVISVMLGFDSTIFDIDKAVRFIMSCYNYDGGFGLLPGQESHGGACYTAVASLVLLGKLDALTEKQKFRLGRWCLRRQVYFYGDEKVSNLGQEEAEAAGMQGRCNKLGDTCYSFWIGGTLQMLGKEWLNMLNKEKLRNYLLKYTQHKRFGGFGKVPGAPPDILHAYFGVCGISLLEVDTQKVKMLDARFGMSKETVKAKISEYKEI